MNETVVRLHESHAHAPFPEEEGVRDSHPDIITYLVPRGEKQVRDAAAAADPAATNITPNGRSPTRRPSVCRPSNSGTAVRRRRSVGSELWSAERGRPWNKNSQDVSWHTHVTTLMARTLAIAQDNLGAESRGAEENSVIQS